MAIKSDGEKSSEELSNGNLSNGNYGVASNRQGACAGRGGGSSATRGGFGTFRGGASSTRGISTRVNGDETEESRLKKRSRSEDAGNGVNVFGDLLNKKHQQTNQSNGHQALNITSDIRVENSMEHENN